MTTKWIFMIWTHWNEIEYRKSNWIMKTIFQWKANIQEIFTQGFNFERIFCYNHKNADIIDLSTTFRKIASQLILTIWTFLRYRIWKNSFSTFSMCKKIGSFKWKFSTRFWFVDYKYQLLLKNLLPKYFFSNIDK